MSCGGLKKAVVGGAVGETRGVEGLVCEELTLLGDAMLVIPETKNIHEHL